MILRKDGRIRLVDEEGNVMQFVRARNGRITVHVLNKKSKELTTLSLSREDFEELKSWR